MASSAAAATGLRISDMTPRICTLPCCWRTLAIPTAVASSHHLERSVSMMSRCGRLFAVLADADVVDGNPKTPVATVSPRRSAITRKRLRRARFRRLAVGALPTSLRVIDPPPVLLVLRAKSLMDSGDLAERYARHVAHTSAGRLCRHNRAGLQGGQVVIRAVMFDFGGVVSTSPFEAFARLETEHGLPPGFIRTVNADRKSTRLNS